LLSLNGAGVSERVLEAMLGAEMAKRQAVGAIGAAAPQTPEQAASAAPAPGQVSSETLAALSQVIDQLATQSLPVEPAPASVEPGRTPISSEPERTPVGGNVPRAWVAVGEEKVELSATLAEVALTGVKRTGATPFKTLQGFAGKALAFANPALGLASGLGGLLRSDDSTMTVWALLGASASQELRADAKFELEFGTIPGVNPDEYRPAVVRLIPTRDNYRLVGAAKSNEHNPGGMPAGPIIQEPVLIQSSQLDRGRYSVSQVPPILPGQYALVLRPIVVHDRERKRNSEGTLGDLMGQGPSHVLYTTWDFSIKL
jgi:hypothetical protein